MSPTTTKPKADPRPTGSEPITSKSAGYAYDAICDQFDTHITDTNGPQLDSRRNAKGHHYWVITWPDCPVPGWAILAAFGGTDPVACQHWLSKGLTPNRARILARVEPVDVCGVAVEPEQPGVLALYPA